MSTALPLLLCVLSAMVGVAFLGWCTLMGVGGMSPTQNPQVERARAFAGAATGMPFAPSSFADREDLEAAEAAIAEAEREMDQARQASEARKARDAARSAKPGASAAPMVDSSRYNN